jgi:SAM-dependent methyltransferase
MNEHHALCATPEWAEHLHGDVLEPLLSQVDLGREMLEIGPGPGAATEWLRRRVARLVAVEIDPVAAVRLAARFAGTNVDVVTGDASHLDFPSASFDSVGSFTMLHHLATTTLQNQFLREALRVLRPGGVLVGCDSTAITQRHDFHVGDVYRSIEPSSLLTRLQTIGFETVMVRIGYDLRFYGLKPEEKPAG